MQTSSLIQPQSAGDILDTALRLYRRQWWLWMGIVALVYVPIVFLIDRWRHTAPFASIASDFQRLIAAQFLNQLWWLLGTGTLLTAALVYGLARAYHTQAVTIHASYDAALRRVGIVTIASLVPFTIDLMSSVVGAVAGWVAIIIWLSLPLFIIYGGLVWLAAHVLFVPYISMLEPDATNPIHILQRSWYLARRSIRRTVLLLSVTKLAGTLLVSAPPYILLFLPFHWPRDHTQINTFLSVYYSVAPAVLLPLQLAVYAVLYYDLRVRYEGYDLEIQIRHDLLKA